AHDVRSGVVPGGELHQELRVAPSLAQALDRLRGVAEPRLGAEVEARHEMGLRHEGGARPSHEGEGGAMCVVDPNSGHETGANVEILAENRAQLAFPRPWADIG